MNRFENDCSSNWGKLIPNCKQLDQRAETEAGLSGLTLMENAGTALAQFIQARYHSRQCAIVIVCGPGNNGGDGLVCARKLWALGYRNLTVVYTSKQYKGDALANWERLKETHVSTIAAWQESDNVTAQAIEVIQQAEVLVDSLFGSGLNRPITGVEAHLITEMNTARLQNRAKLIAVDVPSGVDSETGQILGACSLADITCTLAFGKPGLYLQPGKAAAGQVHMVDIGIPDELIQTEPSPYRLITRRQVKAWLPVRAAMDHKYDHGHLLIVAGSTCMPGAAALCAEAATRSGAGLVTLAAPQNVFQQIQLPAEVMRLLLPDTHAFGAASLEYIKTTMSEGRYHAVALGPGMGQAPETQASILDFIDWLKPQALPVALDADALNALATEPKPLTENFFLTPHVGEASRLLRQDSAEILENLPQAAQAGCEQFSCQFALKSASSIAAIWLDDAAQQGGKGKELELNLELCINPTGNPGMATAGSGDVLTGLLGGLLAQAKATALKPQWMMPLAIYLHGLAGDLAADEKTVYAMRASDITHALPQAFRLILQEENI